VIWYARLAGPLSDISHVETTSLFFSMARRNRYTPDTSGGWSLNVGICPIRSAMR
jgi:hypothetical protein